MVLQVPLVLLVLLGLPALLVSQAPLDRLAPLVRPVRKARQV